MVFWKNLPGEGPEEHPAPWVLLVFCEKNQKAKVPTKTKEQATPPTMSSSALHCCFGHQHHHRLPTTSHSPPTYLPPTTYHPPPTYRPPTTNIHLTPTYHPPVTTHLLLPTTYSTITDERPPATHHPPTYHPPHTTHHLHTTHLLIPEHTTVCACRLPNTPGHLPQCSCCALGCSSSRSAPIQRPRLQPPLQHRRRRRRAAAPIIAATAAETPRQQLPPHRPSRPQSCAGSQQWA